MVKTTVEDYYEILSVPRDADERTIKDAFRTLSLRYHPDRNPEPEAEARFKKIAEALAELSDPQKRATYDHRGHAGVAGFSPEDLVGGINFADIFRGHDLGLGGVGIFDRIFGMKSDRSRSADIQVELVVTLERVFSGGEETVRFNRPQVCAAGDGSGSAAGTRPRSRDSCKGTGQQTTSRDQRGVTFQYITPCPNSGGRGSFIDSPCRECHGSGKLEREEVLSVTIPPGIPDGMALHVPGHGHPRSVPDGSPGDMRVIVLTGPDDRFERRGADLWYRAEVGIPDVVLGSKLDVPTIKGDTLAVDIPPGTQPNMVMRLKDQGLPIFCGDNHGAMFLVIKVDVPVELSEQERHSYEKLRDLAPNTEVMRPSDLK